MDFYGTNLQLQPAGGLVSCSIGERSSQPLFAVGCVSRRAFTNEATQVLHKLKDQKHIARGKRYC